MTLRLTLLLLLAAATLAACSDLVPSAAATALPTAAVLQAPPPDTVELLTRAFHNIRSSATLRLEVEHSGEPWLIATDVGDVAFEEAEVSFVAPDTLQVVAGVKIFGLSAGVDLFARGEQQWYRNALLTGGQWQGGVLVQNFNPQQLVAPGSGLDRAGQALLGLTWQGLVVLEDGRTAHLLRGPARGEEVSALLVNLVQLEGQVQTEVYVERDTLLPLRFVLSQPEIATWEVRVTAVNAAVQLDEPLQAGG